MRLVTLVAMTAMAAGAFAQGQFGEPENSAAILDALVAADQFTKSSCHAAQAYKPNNDEDTKRLTNQNVFLLEQWQNVTFQAQSSLGFYTETGAENIIDYINYVLYPDTKSADLIYTSKRNVFIQGGFINYIDSGLLKLRSAVDAASAAVQAKTPSGKLTAMTIALTKIEQNYADTQRIQKFGS